VWTLLRSQRRLPSAHSPDPRGNRIVLTVPAGCKPLHEQSGAGTFDSCLRLKQFYRSADTEAYSRVKSFPETARQANTRDNPMARGKCRNLSNRKQEYLAP